MRLGWALSTVAEPGSQLVDKLVERARSNKKYDGR
jgi:hypothetical protein